jgi:hypothetical protein
MRTRISNLLERNYKVVYVGDQLNIGMPLQPRQYDLEDFRVYLWGCWSQVCQNSYDPMPFFIEPAYAKMFGLASARTKFH